jgi:hypothetical protein
MHATKLRRLSRCQKTSIPAQPSLRINTDYHSVLKLSLNTNPFDYDYDYDPNKRDPNKRDPINAELSDL